MLTSAACRIGETPDAFTGAGEEACWFGFPFNGDTVIFPITRLRGRGNPVLMSGTTAGAGLPEVDGWVGTTADGPPDVDGWVSPAERS